MKKKELLKRIDVLEDKIETLYNRMSCIDGKGVSPLMFNEEKKELVVELEVGKFAELKEAHKNGAVIQSKSGFGWITVSNPQWYNDMEYRIKPEENPKVGDVVVADYGDDFSIKILRTSDLSSPLFKYTKLTKQQVEDLLFNK